MSRSKGALLEIHALNTIASKDTRIHRLHPLCKLLVTIVYLAFVVSYSPYDFIGLLAMAVYPIAIFLLARLSFLAAFHRLRLVLPLVCLVGLFNPFFDTKVIYVGEVCVRAGVLSMLTLMLKGILALLSSYLLIATTTLEQLCYALQLLHLPRILVTQLLLTYRYITLLLEEIERTMQAYALRAPRQKGIHIRVWGPLVGRLLLRSIDRAGELYDSMSLRGYSGDFIYLHEKRKLQNQELFFLLFWCGLFSMFRCVL